MASECPGAEVPRLTERVGCAPRARRRELQAVRAEELACRRAAETLRLDAADERARLDAAVGEYGRHRAALAGRQTDAHGRLSLALRNRSAAELAAEAVRERAENELKARRTAATVRACRLDATWNRLHGRYRRFVSDVSQRRKGGESPSARQPCRADDATPGPAARTGRFFAAADRVGAQHRRESLRTARSLHALTVGYFRETAAAAGTGARSATDDRAAVPLDGCRPERVLDELRVVQEQCARIAERVRRRSAGPRVDGHAPPLQHADGRERGLLDDARARLAAGREYVNALRTLANREVAAPERDRLRKLVLRTYASCAGTRTAPRDLPDGATVVEIAGRLERACFALFARLDRAAADGRRRSTDCANRDVVGQCLRAVQTRRADDARRARVAADRVDDFCKSVGRLLLATSTVGHSTTGGDASKRARRSRLQPDRKCAAVVVRAPSSHRDARTTAESDAAAAADTATVIVLCPPSIDAAVQYETGQ